MKIRWKRTITFSPGRKERTGWGWDWFLDGYDRATGELVVVSGGEAPSRAAARRNAQRSRNETNRQVRKEED